jgi:hypothetical protein
MILPPSENSIAVVVIIDEVLFDCKFLKGNPVDWSATPGKYGIEYMYVTLEVFRVVKVFIVVFRVMTWCILVGG